MAGGASANSTIDDTAARYPPHGPKARRAYAKAPPASGTAVASSLRQSVSGM